MPILGPHLGGLIGSLLYDLFVGFHWPPDNEEAMEAEGKNLPTTAIPTEEQIHQ